MQHRTAIAWRAAAALVWVALAPGCDLFGGPSGGSPGQGAGGAPLADLPLGDNSASVGLTAVEDALLANINAERVGAGLPALERRPGLDVVVGWWGTQLAQLHQLGHVDAEGRDSEARARAFGDDPGVRCSEIVQWWGGAPSGSVHYGGYKASPGHHDAYMEVGMMNLGPTTHVGVVVIAGTGPTGSAFEGREGSYSAVLFCDREFAIAVDPFGG